MSQPFHVHLGKPNEAVELGMIEQLAEQLRGAFREIARERGGEGQIQVRFDIQDIRKGSLQLDLSPTVIGEDVPDPDEIAATLIADINGLATDNPRPTIGSGLLNRYAAIVALGQRAGLLEFKLNESSVTIGSGNQLALVAALRDQPEPDTRMVGHIETVNIHRRPWTFGLYSKLDRERVECHFPDQMLQVVLHHMEEKALVEVVGEGRFGPVGITPRQIELSEAPKQLVFDAHKLSGFWRQENIAAAGETSSMALERIRSGSLIVA